MNRVEIIGRLTTKPELRYTSSNIAFCRFTIAINRPKREDGTQEADFIDCVVWRGQAENLTKYQDKGNLIAVEGTLRKESYEDKDGNKKSFVEVLANNIEYLQSKNTQNSEKNVQNFEEEPEADPFSDFGESITTEEVTIDDFLD